MNGHFRYQKFLKNKRVPLRIFLAVRQISTENRDIPLLCIKFFHNPKWRNTKGFLCEGFGIVRQKIVFRKSCQHPPPLTENRDHLMQKTFPYPKICQTEKAPLRIFSAQSDKKNPMEKGGPPLLSKIFLY